MIFGAKLKIFEVFYFFVLPRIGTTRDCYVFEEVRETKKTFNYKLIRRRNKI